MKMINVDMFRGEARKRLPKSVFNYIEAGVEDENSLVENTAAFRRYYFLPRRFRNVANVSLNTSIFGKATSAPIFVAPVGLTDLIWPKGDQELAMAASSLGLTYVIPTAATSSMEEIAESCATDMWFQLYHVDWDLSRNLLLRAKAIGCIALILTVDVPSPGKRERDVEHTNSCWLSFAQQMFEHSRCAAWLGRRCRALPAFGNLRAYKERDKWSAALRDRTFGASLTWDDLKRLRDIWNGVLIVKGVWHESDIKMCRHVGIDSLILSNHGGRQLDSLPSPICKIDSAANHFDRELLVDGGIRRGADVIKAIALGAKAVGVGRAVLYGLAVDGANGARDVLRILLKEMTITLAQIGCESVSGLSRDYIYPQGE